jgi:hypothetical protein
LDLPSAIRVTSGSAEVTALVTLARGASRGEAVDEPGRSGVDGPSGEIGPLAGVGLGPVECVAGGTKLLPVPMSPYREVADPLPEAPDRPVLPGDDGNDDDEDDDEFPPSRKSRPKKLVSSPPTAAGSRVRTSNPGAARAPTAFHNPPRIADLLAGSPRLGRVTPRGAQLRSTSAPALNQNDTTR